MHHHRLLNNLSKELIQCKLLCIFRKTLCYLTHFLILLDEYLVPASRSKQAPLGQCLWAFLGNVSLW